VSQETIAFVGQRLNSNMTPLAMFSVLRTNSSMMILLSAEFCDDWTSSESPFRFCCDGRTEWIEKSWGGGQFFWLSFFVRQLLDDLKALWRWTHTRARTFNTCCSATTCSWGSLVQLWQMGQGEGVTRCRGLEPLCPGKRWELFLGRRSEKIALKPTYLQNPKP